VSVIITYAIPIFVVTLIAEMLLFRRKGAGDGSLRGYEWKDTLASLAMGVGSLIVKLPLAGAIFGLSVFLYDYRAFDLDRSAVWFWPALILCEDFCYYWFHRMHHTVRILWAGHINHHSSTHYNLSTALRQPWTTLITGVIFWLPLPLLGFEAQDILTAQAISLLYQYGLHTELVGKLGPIEWIFNTPSHHRVHHGRNAIYLDRNHGGILIIWDRMFGTFEVESIPVDYGLTTNIATYNPFRIAFHEWAASGRDVANAKSARSALAYLFGPPGWSTDGSRKTSDQQRAEVEQKSH